MRPGVEPAKERGGPPVHGTAAGQVRAHHWRVEEQQCGTGRRRQARFDPVQERVVAENVRRFDDLRTAAGPVPHRVTARAEQAQAVAVALAPRQINPGDL